MRRISGETLPLSVGLIVLAIVANMFAGNWGYLGLPVGVDRPLLLLGLVLLLLDATTGTVRWRWFHAIAATCVVWTGYSWMETGSVRDTAKMYAFSDRVVIPLVLFTVGGLVFATTARRDLLLRTLTGLGIYLGTTAIGEISTTPALVWPRFILNPDLGIQFGRARGPFLYSEAMGMTCALTFFAAALLFSRSTKGWRYVAGLSMALSLVGATLCMTRTVWIGTVLGSVVVGLAAPSLRRWVPVALAGAAGVIGLVLWASPSLSASLDDRLTAQRSVYDRVTTNDAASRIVDAHPLFGIGWGRFVEVSPDWIRQGDTIPLTTVDIEVHNVFLSRAAETGVIGAALWGLAMLTGPVLVAVTRARTPEMEGWRLLTIAAIALWLLPSLLSPNNYPLPNNLIWLFAGIAGCEHFTRLRERPDVDHSDAVEAQT